ncbi:cytochrome c [Paenalcaligenes sp. Me131]|uniref:cytochrome c n=1 Tax=Paenalcaligenes sp. Me131 TaxID=3392636 RepID=UPI003D265DBC
MLRKVIITVILVAVAVCIAILLGAFRSTSVAPGVDKPLSADEMQQLIPRGRELAMAGDCFGCHSQPQGPKAAGGVAIGTPFGTLYSTNITPDPTYGIGKYTRADFHRALKDGVAPKGNLYPAMPYIFTHITTPEDIDALYAYLMSIPPIAVANKSNSGAFSLPVRPFMNFWNLLNFPNRVAPENPERSAQWLRGAYLVQGVGHCASCHTPQNFMMGVDFSRDFQGGEINGWAIPNITANSLAKHGFDVATLTQYLSTGIAPQGTSFADMHTVTHFSTSAMKVDDVEAVATYLLTDANGSIPPAASAPTPLPEAKNPAADSNMAIGRRTYLAACAGCHGSKGEGIPNVAPAMYGNATLAMDSAQNLVRVVLNGIPTQTFTGNQRMYAMPPFAHELSDEEIADLSTWMRAQWGGQATAVTPSQVNSIAGSVR